MTDSEANDAAVLRAAAALEEVRLNIARLVSALEEVEYSRPREEAEGEDDG